MDEPEFWNAGEGDLEDDDDEDEEDEDELDKIGIDNEHKATGEDEYFDGRTCRDTEFECHSNHACIPLDQYCDQVKNCADGSDEANCAPAPRIAYNNRTEKPQEGERHKINYPYNAIACQPNNIQFKTKRVDDENW